MERVISSYLTTDVQHELFLMGLSPEPPASDLGKTLVNSNEPKPRRLLATIQLAIKALNSIGVNAKPAISNFYFNSTGLPFEEKPVLQGYGGENFVFLLKGENPTVVKMDKTSIELPLVQQLERARKIKSDHDQISEWFRDVKDFVVPSEFFIGRLPFRNQKAVGTVQPYIEKFRGVFEDFTDNQLTIFFSQNPSVRRNFIKVADKVSHDVTRSDRTIDILGVKNLSIADYKGSPRLVLIDSCDIKDLTIMRKDKKNEDFLERFDIRMKKLQQLRNRAYEIEKSEATKVSSIVFIR